MRPATLFEPFEINGHSSQESGSRGCALLPEMWPACGIGVSLGRWCAVAGGYSERGAGA